MTTGEHGVESTAEIKDPIKISIGAGRSKILGFKTVDLDPASSPDFLMDIRELKFEPHTVSVLYASHVFEHLRPNNSSQWSSRGEYLISVLASWRKCLTAGGQLFICVPNLEKLSAMVTESTDNLSMQKTTLDAIFGGARNEFDYHYSGFTAATLTELLHAAGFKQIASFEPFADDESTHRINGVEISLNLVASNSSDHSEQTSIPPPVKMETSELNMYRDAADNRLQEINQLKKVCAEREKAVFALNVKIDEIDAQNRALDGLFEPKNLLRLLVRVARRWVRRLLTALKVSHRP